MFSCLLICMALLPAESNAAPSSLGPQSTGQEFKRDGENKDRRPWSWNTDVKLYFDDPQVQQLCSAIAKGDQKEVKALLKSGVAVNARGQFDATPLLWCMPNTDNGIFELLLRHGADPNVRFMSTFGGAPRLDGGTVMIWVSGYGSVAGLRKAIEHKGDPNKLSMFKDPNGTWVSSGWTCLTAAIHSRLDSIAKVRLLLDRGADPDVIRKNVNSAFTSAVGASRFEQALVLLAGGASARLYKGTMDSSRSMADLLPCHYLSEDLAQIAKANAADRERILLLVDKVKRLGAWHPEAAAEMARFRSLCDQKKHEEGRKYLRDLRAARELQNLKNKE